MFRLFRLAFIIFVLCTLAVCASRVFGGVTQPLSRFATIFLTSPDGTFCQWPCMFGVRSQITDYLVGVDIMRRHPFSAYIASPMVADGLDWEGKNFTFVLGNYTGNVQRSPLVTSIYVNFNPMSGMKNATTPPFTLITASEVIVFMGKPTAIWQNNDTAQLFYPNNRMVVTVSLVTRDIYHIDASDPDPVIEIHIPSRVTYQIPAGSISP